MKCDMIWLFIDERLVIVSSVYIDNDVPMLR